MNREPCLQMGARFQAVFSARAKALHWVATKLGFHPLPASIHHPIRDQCQQG